MPHPSPTRKHEQVCGCHAYPFPHRLFGGRCEGGDALPQPGDEDLPLPERDLGPVMRGGHFMLDKHGRITED